MKKTIKLLALLLALLMVTSIVLVACDNSDDDDTDGSATYTYTGAFSMSPSTWNPHKYKSSTDSVPLDYTTSGWYEFDWNEAHTGFELVPVLAESDPVDVTDEYVGTKWATLAKISEGDTGRVFRIHLNKDAKWDNGETITADDYIYSMQQLLSPQLINYRASDYYQGASGIVGARNYFYSNRTVYSEQAGDKYESLAEADKTAIIFSLGTDYDTVSAVRKYWSRNFGDSSYEYDLGLVTRNLSQLGYDYMGHYPAEEGEEQGKEEWRNVAAQIAALEGKTLAAIEADESSAALLLSLVQWWAEDEEATLETDDALDFFLAPVHYDEASWDDVGFLKIDDYTIDWICTGSLEGFFIKRNLGNSFLVYQPIYDKCKTQNPTTGVWTSTYGTAVDKYMGYGPYKMTKYIADQIMEFEKSSTWFGFTEKYADTYSTFEREIDGATVQQYQTTKVTLRYVPEITTREQMFLTGQLVGLGLDKDLLAKYLSSRALYYAQGSVTYYGIIASDFENLQAREATKNGVQNYNPETYDGSTQKYNKTILSIKEFRMALAYGLNRDAVAQLMPGSSAAFSLFSGAVLSDPITGATLNSHESIKKAICEFWGVTWGEGGDFATLDAAYKALTGYDPERARQLINTAVDKAIEQKLMGPDTIVSIEYGASSQSETEVKWYETFRDQFLELMKGTKLEGKFEYTANYTLGNEYGDRIRTGSVDTAWGFGFSGAELDPFGFMEVFVDSAFNSDGFQYDRWVNWEGTNITISLDIDGQGAKEYTYDVPQWFFIINGGETVWGEDYEMAIGLPDWSYGKVSDDIRVEVLAAMQKTILSNYTTIPMSVDGGAQLKSYKINYGLETYNMFIGFGGIRFITYNYTDAEWDAFVSSQGGRLSY